MGPFEDVNDGLAPIRQERLSGSEPVIAGGRTLGISVADFWAWSASDLVSNTTRGILAEFLVAVALGVESNIREEWAAFDLTTKSGIKVEVKSAAYVQAWEQKRLSTITFGTPMTRVWSPESARSRSAPRRQADVYVFALFAETNPQVLNPLDTDQWVFYVLSTRRLDERERSQSSITLPSLKRMVDSVTFDQLEAAVDSAASEQRVE